jgi:ABC-type cobalamin transport system ATPase subunit
MSLSFPNQSRSFDATRCAVRFWGHDGAMEASFFVTDDALRRITPNMQQFDESGILSAFDLNRNLIHAIAAKVYGRGRKRVLRAGRRRFLTYDSAHVRVDAVGKRM